MKAIRIHETGSSEVMHLEEVETPMPQANEVLIRVAVAGVNYVDAKAGNISVAASSYSGH